MVEQNKNNRHPFQIQKCEGIIPETESNRNHLANSEHERVGACIHQ